MTKEDKQLLLKDLCMRLPYGVIMSNKEWHRKPYQLTCSDVQYMMMTDDYEDVPYLRPMSSMTKEEKNYYEDRWFEGYHVKLGDDMVFEPEIPSYIDWLLSHHFDFRGLIEKGLAIEITEDKKEEFEKYGKKPQRMISAEAKEALYAKINSKFKVGDWIVQENIGVYKVVEICNLWYEVIDVEDNHYSISYGKECMCHLWSIEDAKKGDVLQLGEVTAIFKEYIGSILKCKCYCSFYKREFEIPIDNIYGCTNAKPATKKQRDHLFQKMKDAGYEWDADKKELKKGGEE